MNKANKKISAENFDKKFEAGEDITEYLDLDSAIKKINVDFPVWMVKELDAEATRLQIARQAVIKMWIDERLAQNKREKNLNGERRKKEAS
jgi:hypothetical protein